MKKHTSIQKNSRQYLEVLHQNPEILRSAVIEVLEEKKAQFEHLDRERQIEIEEIVRRDFERYESVFRVLAKGPE